MRALVHDVAWRCDMNCVRSKDAHKQLARTSLSKKNGGHKTSAFDTPPAKAGVRDSSNLGLRLRFPAKFSPSLSPSPSLAVNVFALIHCPGQATASCSSAYWPYLDFHHHHHTACREIATTFDSIHSFPHIFHIYTKFTATPTHR